MTLCDLEHFAWGRHRRVSPRYIGRFPQPCESPSQLDEAVEVSAAQSLISG